MTYRDNSSSVTPLYPESSFHVVSVVCAVAFFAYVTARLGDILVLRPEMIWPLWPGCAFLVAVLLLTPRKMWAALLIAGLGGFAVYDLSTGLTIRSTAMFLLSDAVEILVAALGVRYLFGGTPRLDSVKSLAKYSFFAAILAPISVASVAASTVGGYYRGAWRIAFLTEALALLTLTPAILSWADIAFRRARKSSAYYLEAASMFLGLMVVAYVTFVALRGKSHPALLYALVPFLLWSGLRFGVMGASTSMLMVSFFSIWGVIHGQGPFLGGTPVSKVLSLQFFLLFATSSFMVLAALVEEHKAKERQLRESEQRFRLLADSAPALIWMSDTNKVRNYLNKPWLDFTGLGTELDIGDSWAQAVHPEDVQKCRDTYRQSFERREKFTIEYRLRRNDGQYRWILEMGVPRFDQAGFFAGYMGIGIDVTDRILATRELAQANEKFSKAFQESPMALMLTSAKDHRYVDVNETFERLTGWSRDEVIGRSPFDIHVWVDAKQGLQMVEHLTAEGSVRDWEVSYRRKDGEERVGLGSAELIEIGNQTCVLSVMADITDRKRAEEALSNMSRKLIEAQEQERTRIARDLHDDLAQRLAMSAIELEQVLRALPDSAPDLRRRVNALRKRTVKIATDVQTMSHQLHSSKLEYLGLATAMRSFCKEFGERQKLEIEFSSHDLPSPLSPDISLCLFRVLQEALNNAAKHSGVRHFEVQLLGSSSDVHLTVSDGGQGFDVEAAINGSGLGLTSMRERLRLVNGQLAIVSQPQRGTTVHARVPFSQSAQVA